MVKRAREFLFDPARFKNDPAVLGMSVTARGAYAILFCEGWDMPEPGVIPSDDATLSMLSRADMATWLTIRSEVATAYDTVSRPGFWVQKGTARTHAHQNEWYERQRELGSIGGKASWKARRRPASRPATRPPSRPAEALVSRGGEGKVLSGKDKEKDSDPSLASGSSNGVPDPTPVGVQGPVAIAPGRRKDGPPDEEYFAGLGARIKP
jgi:hypothetical protein